MSEKTHINVTINFRNWNEGCYDLRIPIYQPIKPLILNLAETLNLSIPTSPHFTIKVATKNLLVADDDILIDYPVTDGDILIIL